MDDDFDLSAVDVRPRSQEGVEMELVTPDGRPTGVFLRVRGTDSEVYNDMLKAQIRRAAERAPRRATEEEKNAEFWELQASLVAGWRGRNLKLGGRVLEYSPAHAAMLLEQYAWVYEQVSRFANNRANFLPGPSGS